MITKNKTYLQTKYTHIYNQLTRLYQQQYVISPQFRTFDKITNFSADYRYKFWINPLVPELFYSLPSN